MGTSLTERVRELREVLVGEFEPDSGPARTSLGPGALAVVQSDDYVDEILSRAGGDLAGSAIAAGVGWLTPLVDALNLVGSGDWWKTLPHGLRWVVGRAIGAAAERLQRLLSQNRDRETLKTILDDIVERLLEYVVKGPLATVLEAGEVIRVANERIGSTTDDSSRSKASHEMAGVVAAHKHRTRWVRRGNWAAPKLYLVSVLGFPPGTLTLAAAAIVAVLSVYLAHDHLDSPRLAPPLAGFFVGIGKAVEMAIS